MQMLTKKPKKLPKTSSIRWWIKQTQIKFNKLVTSSTGYCQWCGSEVNQLQCSHIYPIGAYPSLRFNILNVLCLCAYCHKFKWHDNPLDSWKWFEEKFPERFTYLQTVKNNYHKFTIDEIKEIQGFVLNKEFKKLLSKTS